MSNAPKKPQAFSHMLWFFLIPCLGFLLWATSRWVSEVYIKPQKPEAQLSLTSQIEKIEKAKNPGDRWQAAYALSHFVQKALANRSWSLIPNQEKASFFDRLSTLLDNQQTDLRLIKYAILMLGQIKDARALETLFKQNQKNISDEINFFSGWAAIEILTDTNQLNAISADSKKRYFEIVKTWLKSKDSALRKISSVYLIQFGTPTDVLSAKELIQDPDREVRWNTIIALASIKAPESSKLLAEIFSIKELREVEFRSTKDIFQTLRSAFITAQKLNSPEVNAAIEQIKKEARPKTPEGDAILAALRLDTLPQNNRAQAR
jgi:HEAT repeat protein